MYWQFMKMGADSAEVNMATDRDLFDRVAAGQWPPTCRFYSWRQLAFSFGYSQKIDQLVDVQACRLAGLELVQRPTGGGLVIHGWDLTYTLIGPTDGQRLPRGLLDSYRQVHQWIQQAFGALGIDVQLAPEQRLPGVPSLCLSNVAPHDLLLNGQKIGGGAQRRRKGYLLHQGYIALDVPPREYLRLSGSAAATGAINTGQRRVERDALVQAIQQVLIAQ